MKKSTLLIVILSLLIFINPTYAKNSDYMLHNERVYQLSNTYIVKNTGNCIATDIILDIFIGRENFTAYQKDIKIQYSLEPDRTINDKYGNKTAKYVFEKLLPGEELEIQVTRKVESSDIEFKIDPLKLENAKLDISKYNMYLQQEEKIETKDPEIVSKALELTKNLNSEYEKAKEIFKFVNTYMTYDDSSEYKDKGASSALATGRGVCVDYAELFVAFCRVAGIPARVIEGYRLDKAYDYKEHWVDIVSDGHAWAELYLEGYGWLPIEITEENIVNGKREAFWDGFLRMNSSEYITIGIYNPLKNDTNLSYLIPKGHNDSIKLEPIKQFVKEVDVKQLIAGEDNIIDEEEKNCINYSLNNYWLYKKTNNEFVKGIEGAYNDKSIGYLLDWFIVPSIIIQSCLNNNIQ